MPTNSLGDGCSPPFASVDTYEYPNLSSESGLLNGKNTLLPRGYTTCIVLALRNTAMTGSQLREIRRQLGLTQVALAARLAVSANTVARWERNEVPIREPMARLIALLKLTAAMKARKR